MRRRALIAASQVGLSALAYLGAFVLVFDIALPAGAFSRFAETLPWLIALRLALFYRFRLDRSSWKHVGMPDLVCLVEAATLGSVLFPVLLLFLRELFDIPVAVFLVDWLLVVALTAGVRIATRFWVERRHPAETLAAGRRTLIVGAGDAGEQLLRQILHDPRRLFHVVGLIDDDPGKRGMALHGVPVLGTTDDIRRLAAAHQASLTLIAIPSAAPDVLRRLVDRAVEAGTEVKLLPPLQDLMEADVHMSNVRDVQVEDLLGREQIQLENTTAQPEITGKVVLITGAGGSIGSELARQVARFHPRQLILLERAESPLYFIEKEVCRENPAVDVVPMLASVTNLDRLQQIFDTYRPDVVFHAAAYKHVPMLEANVVEGVWNNVMGTLRVARCSARAGTGKFVCISTDKAVNPTSVLGTTKRIAERIVLELPSLRSSGTDFRVVRFGNVLGSDGSVVPLFKRQLEAGGPITVTHPEVRRYFMTIPEAVQLVLQSVSLPECAGRISLLEMGTQIRIVDLAEQLIRLAGLTPGKDIQIVFTGLRPGEKLEEELLAPAEKAVPTTIDKIRVVEATPSDGALLAQRLRHLLHLMARHDEQGLLRALDTLVPDHQAPSMRETPMITGRLALGTQQFVSAHTNGNGNGNGNGHGNGRGHRGSNGNGTRARRTGVREPRGQAPVPLAPPRRTGSRKGSA